jgi:hypothetical protein
LNARDGFRAGIEFMQQSARLMSAMPGSNLFCDWRELDHKFEAFRLFQYADREMKLPVDRLPIDEVVRSVPTQDAFRAIWILEGIGRIQGLAANLSVEGLLRDGPGASVPDTALIPLHAGMGTAFGERLLAGLATHPSTAELQRTIERFVEMCRANCRPGWEDACIEPIGLLVRCLYPHLLVPASAAMEAVSPGYRRLFWHGVGRSLYFVPTNFLPIPGAAERMARGAAAEGSRTDDHRQAFAGLIWAVALVNLPWPGVIRSLIQIASQLRLQNEFTNGLISALLSWRHMAPGDVRHLRTYTQPLPAHDRRKVLCETWIGKPAREALQNLYPGLERRNRIPSLYTYRTPEELRELSGATCEDGYGRQQPGRTFAGASH